MTSTTNTGPAAESGSGETPPSRQGGSQTLARGLAALMAVVDSESGLTVHDVAKLLGVHRSIAYRVLQTLVDFDLVAQTSDKVYRPGARLASLSEAYLPTVRDIALPAMRELAETVGCTVSLFVAEGDNAVSIATAEPTTAQHHLRFRAGMRTPLNRGAAGYALMAQLPAVAGEPESVARARTMGYAISHGEIETEAHAVAAAFSTPGIRACVNVMTYVEEQAQHAIEHVTACARTISDRISLTV